MDIKSLIQLLVYLSASPTGNDGLMTVVLATHVNLKNDYAIPTADFPIQTTSRAGYNRQTILTVIGRTPDENISHILYNQRTPAVHSIDEADCGFTPSGDERPQNTCSCHAWLIEQASPIVDLNKYP